MWGYRGEGAHFHKRRHCFLSTNKNEQPAQSQGCVNSQIIIQKSANAKQFNFNANTKQQSRQQAEKSLSNSPSNSLSNNLNKSLSNRLSKQQPRQHTQQQP